MSSRCFPHIVNICCQHITAEFTDAKLVEGDGHFDVTAPHSDPELQTFDEAVQRDPIALGRVVVRTIRASGQRREHFKNEICEGNVKKHFFIGDRVEIIVPELELLRDVRTRWDSIFFMISRLRIMRPVRCTCYCVAF
jgi:hypothetical protein